MLLTSIELSLSELLDTLVAFCHKALRQTPVQQLQLLAMGHYRVAKYQEGQSKLLLEMNLCKATSFCQQVFPFVNGISRLV